MGEATKICFVWPGDPINRIFRGLKDLKPDRIIVLVEDADEKWREFQMAQLDVLKLKLGEMYADSIEVVKEESFNEDLKDIDHYGGIVRSMFRTLRQVQKNLADEDVELVWEVTGAPLGVILFIPVIASLAASERCQVVVQHVQRADSNDPILHASSTGAYYKKHKRDLHGAADKPLSEWRRKESEDPGSEIRRIRFPRLDFDLLATTDEADARRRVFAVLPASNEPQISTREILARLKDDDAAWETIERRAFAAKASRARKSGARVSPEDVRRSIDIWLSITLNRFVEIGLAESSKPDRYLHARRSYCGDIFAPTIQDMLGDAANVDAGKDVPDDEGAEPSSVTS
jgi:hypothetical protein